MKKYFLKLYQYNAWANRKVLACLQSQHVTDEKIFSIFGHVMVAQLTWLSRIETTPNPGLKLWGGDYTMDQLQSMSDEGSTKWLSYVERTESFDRILVYKNFQNLPYESNVETIMIHTVNHASYHRAQIALLLRQKGFEPVNTDFITYDRVLLGQLKD
jgi:uncharacterized damage-inducible protein DinB